ncbi:YjdF family protein [Candidatus Fukatsuia endosymbiont of Tuberolachnus salignus]|uniref:YjdF family protein n=1 Tax=Candidatus Fukatsuia endosymbiont of Tuberolachnus salignus TaxID=3077957 RepID=UPI00313ACB9A
MKPATIKITVLLKNSLWVALFERIDEKGYTVARTVFGDEPTAPEIYEFIATHFYQLKFTEPRAFKTMTKRQNPKRVQREVRKKMEMAKLKLVQKTQAQEVLRLELEKNKQLKKSLSKFEKEELLQKFFLLRQAKRKKKKRGH